MHIHVAEKPYALLKINMLQLKLVRNTWPQVIETVCNAKATSASINLVQGIQVIINTTISIQLNN